MNKTIFNFVIELQSSLDSVNKHLQITNKVVSNLNRTLKKDLKGAHLFRKNKPKFCWLVSISLNNKEYF